MAVAVGEYHVTIKSINLPTNKEDVKTVRRYRYRYRVHKLILSLRQKTLTERTTVASVTVRIRYAIG